MTLGGYIDTNSKVLSYPKKLSPPVSLQNMRYEHEQYLPVLMLDDGSLKCQSNSEQ